VENPIGQSKFYEIGKSLFVLTYCKGPHHLIPNSQNNQAQYGIHCILIIGTHLPALAHMITKETHTKTRPRCDHQPDPQVRVRASALPPEVAKTNPLRFSFYLSMRPASLDTLDSNTLPIGIPSSVPIEGWS